MCADAEGVHFLSGDYLHEAGGAKEDWAEFFSGLNVADQPRIRTTRHQIYEWSLDELRRLTEQPERERIALRASSISGIAAYSYVLDDFELDPPILETIRNLCKQNPPGWKDRLSSFAALLEAGWADYRNNTSKVLRYARYYSSDVKEERVAAPTAFARFLRDEPWLPVLDDLRTARRPSELVLNTVENMKLADRETLLCYCNFAEDELISFLGIRRSPPETTPLDRLQYAVERQEDDLNEYKKLYSDLAGASSFDKKELREKFRDNPLIFVPDHDPRYITSKEAVYASRTRLAPRMAAIKDAYPDLESFFTESLQIPTAESLEHYIEFLRDYAWELRPSLTDNLRTAIESCYRQFFGQLDETEKEARTKALELLKERLGSPTLVFCAEHGWVDTTKITVLYPDTPAYEDSLSDRPEIAIESHLKRLDKSLNDVRPLLDVLNVSPVSDAIRRVPEIADASPHPQTAEFGERLALLVGKLVTVVEGEQAKTESTSRNITLFLQEWRERSELRFRDVRFYTSPPIKVRDELIADGTLLRETNWGSYVLEGSDNLEIYMSGTLLDVFDSIADQLRDILRLDLLPGGFRDDITNLAQGNLARLDSQHFEDHLNQRLREKGFAVAEDEMLQRLEQSATQPVEAAAQTDFTEHAQEPEPATERRHSPTSVGGNSSSGSNVEMRQPPPMTLTPEEILSQLPEFDETSYGTDRVVDLSSASQWQNPAQQPGLDRGSRGSSGGGGTFRNLQAYRDAHGKRGEQWVVEQEKRALIDAGKPDLAELVLHKSESHEGSPWDIESFEKSHPYRHIYVEVKSTSEADNFEVDMSIEQIQAALRTSPPYYLYRVMDVHTSKPTVYIYNFKRIFQQIQFNATDFSVVLPRPEQPEP